MDAERVTEPCDIPQGGGMRRIQSLFKTLLMLIPMTAVPVMAIFGIPQVFPVSASPPLGPQEAAHPDGVNERRAGQSDALLVRSVSTAPSAAIDLFQPYDGDGQSKADVVANAASSQLAQRRLNWTDPLAAPDETHEVTLRSGSGGSGYRGSFGRGTGHQREVRSRQQFPRTSRSQYTSSFSGQAAVPPETPGTSAGQSLEAGPDHGFDRVRRPDAEALPSGIQRATTGESNQRIAGRYVHASRHEQPNGKPTLRPTRKTLSWQQAVARLNELGIRTFRLTPDSGQHGYRFVCLVTSVDDPRISRRFEAESTDPLGAVSDVLAQVENWNLQR